MVLMKKQLSNIRQNSDRGEAVVVKRDATRMHRQYSCLGWGLIRLL